MGLDLFDPGQAQVLSHSDYRAFSRALSGSNCRRCGLAAGRTNIVVDRGNPEAKVLFVGEAPGQNEDLEAKAFVGRSGKLLDGMLAGLDFNTNQEALIVNVVKCRPPKNRPPTLAEVEACSPFLKKQMRLIKPKIVAMLGATALRHLIPQRTGLVMKDSVGRFFTHPDYEGMQLMVLYHPAYILRDPRKKPIMQEHLLRLVSFWRELRKTEEIARKATY